MKLLEVMHALETAYGLYGDISIIIRHREMDDAVGLVFSQDFLPKKLISYSDEFIIHIGMEE